MIRLLSVFNGAKRLDVKEDKNTGHAGLCNALLQPISTTTKTRDK